jgi:hypothetical protein
VAVSFICAARCSGTTFTTNSPVASILSRVSFLVFLTESQPGTKHSVGGSVETPVKKEKGARLCTPAREIDDTHAMGRGTMQRIIHG